MTLPTEELDPDLIEDPLKTSDIKVDKTFVVDGGVPVAKGINPEISTVNTGPLGSNIPGELPDFSAMFKIIDENHTRVLSFKDVEQQLITGKTVSQETARYIDQVFGNFLSDSEGYSAIVMEGFKLKSFTQEPSSINYKKVIEYVKLRIAKEEGEVIDGVSSIISGYIKDTISKLNDFINADLHTLLRSINTTVNDSLHTLLRSTNSTVIIDPLLLKQLRDSKDLVIFVGEESVNLGTIDLLGTNINEIQTHVTLNKEQYDKYVIDLVNCLESISEILKKKALLSFIMYLKNGSGDLNYFDVIVSNVDLIFKQEEKSITLLGLLSIFLEKDVASKVEDIYVSMLGSSDDHYGWNVGKLTKLIDDFNNKEQIAKSAWLETHNEDLKESIEVLHNLDMLRVLLSGLIYNICSISGL